MLARVKTLHLKEKKHIYKNIPFELNRISEVVGMLICGWDGVDPFIFSEVEVRNMFGKWPAFEISPARLILSKKFKHPKWRYSPM